MPDIQTSNLGGSMNPNGNVTGVAFSQMQNPNIPYQSTGSPNWMQQMNGWLSSDSMSQGMGMGSMGNMDMLSQADQMGGQLFGLLAGRNESTVGNIMKAMPLGSTIGNLWNAAFGSHINDEFVTQTNMGINSLKSRTFGSRTNADALNDWKNFSLLSRVNKDEVGSDGWFSNKAKNTTNDLNYNIGKANDLALLNYQHAVENADRNTDLRIQQNSLNAAYGGPIGSFRRFYANGGTTSPFNVGTLISSIYSINPREEFLGEPAHHYDFTQSEEWANAHGYYPDARGHRDDRVKKLTHPSHPSRGTWFGNRFELTDKGMLSPNYIFFGLNDGGQDPQAILTYKGSTILPELTITPKGNYIENPYDNIRLHIKAEGGYLNQAKALIRQNEGWREKPYNDAPKGKNWRSVGYGFNDSGFREKYPDGISKHYEHGITKKQAEEELNYFLNKAEKQLKSIYGKQWNQFSDNEKAAILDTYYQRPASVGKSSRFYKAITAGEDAGRYLGVAGFTKRNKIRQGVFNGGYSNYGDWGNSETPEPNSSSLQEVTPIPVVQGLDLSEVTPTQAKALELNLPTSSFNMNLFSNPSTYTQQQVAPTVGTVEDFLASYDNLYDDGGWMNFLNSWNQAQGKGGYVGQGQNLFNGIQTNTNNGSVQDWLSIASGTVNTIANWGKEDPTLGRSGYGQFGMMAYDVAKAIRDATKHRKEPMDQKLGIPIYAQGGHLFDDGGGMGAMGYAQIGLSALKLASNAKHQASLDDDIDENKINRSINRFGYSLSNPIANVQTNGDLLDLWNNATWMQSNLTMRDFRDNSLFDDFLNGYAASWEGFNAGAQTGNPYAAAAGAIIGGLSSNIASLIGRNKAKNAAEDTNKRTKQANERILADLNYAADRVDAENDLRMLQNMDADYVTNAANGGQLSMGFGLKDPFIVPNGTANPLYRAFGGGLTHGAVFDTGVNFVNEGDSHERNPYGGVQVGTDEQGIPNLVEEDEAIWNGDYVFSRRMKVPKKLAAKYKLGGDITFADAVKKLTKESEERPLDKIARNTQDYILGEFADTQEEMRMAKAQRAMDKEMQLSDDFLTGFQYGLGGHMSPLGLIPNADNISPFETLSSQFRDGGGIHIDPSKKGTFKAQASKMGMGVQQAASPILANKEDYSPAMVKKAVFAKDFAHAYGGSLFGDGGTLLGPNFFVDGGTIKKFQEGMKKSGQYTNEQIDQLAYQKYGEEAWKYRLSNKNWENGYDSRTGKNYIRYNDPNLVQATSNRGNKNKGQESSSQKPAEKKIIKTTAKGATPSTKYQIGETHDTPYDWEEFLGRVRNYNKSKQAGNIVGNYAIDNAFPTGNYTNIKEYENSDDYKNFTDRVLKFINSNPEWTRGQWKKDGSEEGYILDYLDALIEQTPDNSRVNFFTKYDKDGRKRFRPEAADLFTRLRNDHKGGVVHINPKYLQDEFTPMEVVETDPEAAWDFGDYKPTVADNTTSVNNSQQTNPQSNPFKPKQTWTRNIPWLMSGAMGLKEMLTPPDYGNADMILNAAYQAGQPISIGTEYVGDYRKRDPFDERYLMNMVNQNRAAANRNMLNLSGGNRAIGMAGILSNDLTNQMALAEAARQAYLANRADDESVFNANYRTNKGNADAQNARNIAQAQLNSHRQNALLSGIGLGARMRQAIKDQRDAAISANLTNFAQSLGDLGKENGFYNMLGGLNEEGVLKYFFGDDWKTRFSNNNANV